MRAATAVPSPDGAVLLAGAGGDGAVRWWDPLTGAAGGAPLTGHDGSVTAVVAVESPDGRALLVTAADDATARLWDPVTRREIARTALPPTRDPVPRHRLAALPGARLVATLGSHIAVLRLDTDALRAVDGP